MTRPTVPQAEAWQPDALRRTADDWDAAAVDLQARVDATVYGIDGSRDFWTGSAADAARRHGATVSAGGALATRCLITAAVAARDGAEQMGSAQADVLDLVAAARAEGFVVADDGSVTGGATSPLLVSLSGGSPAVTRDVLTARIVAALDRLGAADADTARDIVEALNPPHAPPAQTDPAGSWPVPLADAVAGWSAIGQDRIANQITSMTPGTAPTPCRRIPQAGRQHRRCPLGDADRGQPGQYRAGDRRRTPRGQAGVARADRVLPGIARGGRRPGAEPAAGWIARSSRSTPTGHR